MRYLKLVRTKRFVVDLFGAIVSAVQTLHTYSLSQRDLTNRLLGVKIAGEIQVHRLLRHWC